MNKEELERLLEEQAGANSKKAWLNIDRDKVRLALNVVFMALGVVGVITYFYSDHVTGMVIVAIGLAFKVIEFLVRFLL